MLSTATLAAIAPRIYESHDSTTEGDVTIDVDPDTAFRAATDYARWSAIFPTVRRAIVQSEHGDEALVMFEHTDGTRDRLHFKNHPAGHVIAFDEIGGDADVHAEIAFTPGDRPSTTHVHSRLRAAVHGLASVFVSGSAIRKLREQQVRDDLVYLQAFFRR